MGFWLVEEIPMEKTMQSPQGEEGKGDSVLMSMVLVYPGAEIWS